MLDSSNQPDLQPDPDNFILELDAAVESHMGWTRRVMRCAVLRAPPGEDVLDPLAHNLCRFGRWFRSAEPVFAKLNVQNTQQVMVVHRSMHDAIRSICTNVLAGRPGNCDDLDIFEQNQIELIKLLAEFKTQFLANALHHDHLTGLPLRFELEEEFLRLKKLRDRYKLQLYVAMIDVDYFKKVNDTYGHSVGDIALRHIADTLKRNFRSNDLLFRYGGEEFLLLMLAEKPEESTATAERMIKAVRDAPVPISKNVTLTLTVTIGISRVVDDEHIGSVIERADKALYEGKKAGRNRCKVAPP
jgi:diguanylate cyclase